MAEMFQPKKQSLKKSDYNKAIVKANEKLKAKNKSIESSIKDKEKELKSLNKDQDSLLKKLRKFQEEVEFKEERLQKINGGLYSADKLLKTKLDSISKSEKEIKSNEKTLLKVEKKESKLKEDIKGLELYKVKCSESKDEIKSLKEDKDKLLKSIDNLKYEEKLLSNGYSNKVTAYKMRYEELEEDAKKHEEMISKFEQRLLNAKDQALIEEKKLGDIQSKVESTKKKSNDELQALKNLCNDTEDKYIEWEQKVAKEKVKSDKQLERNRKAIEQFKVWKIGVLEEVARLKLKSKVDNIDKAGLSDILNG
tara:strand:+ start:665 stop:1591 length:927 start_codon:yes stop_codon:yes gene_type:complete